MDDRMMKLEERVAELTRTADDLSDLTATQAAEIDRLTRQVSLLMQREAEREVQIGGSEILADRKPPHW